MPVLVKTAVLPFLEVLTAFPLVLAAERTYFIAAQTTTYTWHQEGQNHTHSQFTFLCCGGLGFASLWPSLRCVVKDRYIISAKSACPHTNSSSVYIRDFYLSFQTPSPCLHPPLHPLAPPPLTPHTPPGFQPDWL
jgi:hypothetical protein